jgi:hypothetical protein
VVEHYTDGFDPDSIASGSIVQKSQEKDIIFSPIEKDVPIERLKENVMGAAVTIQSVISSPHSLSVFGRCNTTDNYPFKQIFVA